MNYCEELVDISTEILSLRTELVEVQSIIITSWKGKSGTAADEKVETLKQRLEEADDGITNAVNLLTEL